jgi:hypothetical protein
VFVLPGPHTNSLPELRCGSPRAQPPLAKSDGREREILILTMQTALLYKVKHQKKAAIYLRRVA